jgi:hypothetical protein
MGSQDKPTSGLLRLQTVNKVSTSASDQVATGLTLNAHIPVLRVTAEHAFREAKERYASIPAFLRTLVLRPTRKVWN